MKVKNYMEDVVDYLLPDVLKSYPDLCKCQHCVSDIKALTLNNLPPKYVATPIGEVYTRINELSLQFEADAIKEILQAIKKVAQHPRHT